MRAVEDVAFSVEAGERLVLLGPSGCGKSSILKAIAGFIQPSRGSIAICGRAITSPGPDRAVVFQEFDQLLPWKTVKQNVMFPLRVARKLPPAEASDRADDALATVGLTRVMDVFPHALSGGMKQRVAIARALAMKPDILLMDEPFASLDARTRQSLQADLLAFAEDIGFTLVFVTHAIDEAILIGTRLLLLSAHPGRVVATVDTSQFEINDLESEAFEATTRNVHQLLFHEDRRHV